MSKSNEIAIQLSYQVIKLINEKKETECLKLIDELGNQANVIFVERVITAMDIGEHGNRIIQMTTPKNNIITLAINNKMADLADKLISIADAETLNHLTNGVSLLSRAAHAGMSQTCKTLISVLESKCINSVDNQGFTALTYAIASEMTEVSKILIDKMSNEAISAYNPTKGITALSMAIAKNSDELCKLLIPKTSNEAINVRDDWSYTALMGAMNHKLEEVCLLLIPKMNSQSLEFIQKGNNFGIEGTIQIANSHGLEQVVTVLESMFSNQSHDDIAGAIKQYNDYQF